MIVAPLATYLWLTYASPVPAHQKSIPLPQAVNDFNKRRHDAAEAAGQPDLTVEAVLAAIRWAMLDRPMLSVTNATFATLGRITEMQALPKGFELELLTGYEPNDQKQWAEQPAYAEPPLPIEGPAAHWNHREDEDYYSQPGALFRLMSPVQQQILFENTARSVGGAPKEIQLRHIRHCLKADPAYGKGIADALGIALSEVA